MDFITDNGAVKGTNLFVSYEDENVVGKRTDKFFVKESIALSKDIKPNDIVDIDFNNKGKVLRVSKVNQI